MQDINPYAPPSHQNSSGPVFELEHRTPRRHKWIRISLAVYAFTVLLGVGAAAYDIGSIIVSGPILLLIGTVLAVLGFYDRHLPVGLLGISSFALAALIVALINLVPYSPTTGYWPLLTVIGIYACVSLPLIGWLWFSTRMPGK